MIPVGKPLFFQTAVPAQPSHASAVRRMVTAHLNLWRRPELVDNAVLATAELFANAVRHACSTSRDVITITMECSDCELKVTIMDPSPRLPQLRTPDAAEECGRGLSIVAALVDDWGTEPSEPYTAGKKVWFTLAAKDRP